MAARKGAVICKPEPEAINPTSYLKIALSVCNAVTEYQYLVSFHVYSLRGLPAAASAAAGTAAAEATSTEAASAAPASAGTSAAKASKATA